MKCFRFLIILVIAMVSMMLCSVDALAAFNEGIYYQLYPTLSANETLEEQIYSADFNKNISITFMDLQFKYGQLALISTSFPEQSDRGTPREVWANNDWNFPKGFVVYENPDGNTDKSVFDWIESSSDIEDNDYDFSKQNNCSVTYTIKANALKVFKLDNITIAFLAGNDPSELQPVWKGTFYKNDSAEKPDNTNEVQNLTLSMLQLSLDGETWEATLTPEDGEALETIQARATEGLSIVKEEDFEVKQAGDVVAKRWIEAWNAEGREEPYVLRAVKDDSAKGNETVKVVMPESLKKQNESSAPKTGDDPSPEEREPLVLSLIHEDEEPIRLMEETENGQMRAVSTEALELNPGDYQLTLQGGLQGEEVAFTLSVDGVDGEAQSLVTGEDGLPVKVEPGKRYTLTIANGEEDESASLEWNGRISESVNIDAVQIVHADDATPFDALETVINIANQNEGDQLVFSGLAQCEVPLAWSLSCGETVVDSGKTACEANEAGEEGWKVSIKLDNDPFKDLEGELAFEIHYDVEMDAPAEAGKAAAETEGSLIKPQDSCRVKVDTKAPEGYIVFVVGEEIREASDQEITVFERKADQEIEVRIGEIKGGVKEESAVTWIIGSDEPEGIKIEEVDSAIKISYALKDEAGNLGEVTGSVRVVEPIQIEKQSFEGKQINIACLGQTIEVSGSAEPGEVIEWRVEIGKGEDFFIGQEEWQEIQGRDDGAWMAQYMLPEELSNEKELKFEVRYRDEALRDVVGVTEPLIWEVDVSSPDAPQLTVMDHTGTETHELVTGLEYTLLVTLPDDDGLVTVESVSMSLNGGAKEEVLLEDDVYTYSFKAQSGQYEFTASVVDEAGNRSEFATTMVEAANRIIISNSLGETGALLNAEILTLKDGLEFRILADVGRELVCQCLIDGKEESVGVLDKGNEHYDIALSALKEYNKNNNKPVELELRVYYDGMDREKYEGAQKLSFDLWAPIAPEFEVATTGNKRGAFFNGEPIVVRVNNIEEDEIVTVTANDVELEDSSKDEFDELSTMQGGISDAADEAGIKYFMLRSAQSDSQVITVTVTDEAGNRTQSPKTLTRYDETQKIKHSPVNDKITRVEDSSVTVYGNSAIPRYYLVSDDEALGGRKIIVNGNGTWELKLEAKDIPADFEGDVWSFDLKYPNDAYNTDKKGDSMADRVEVPVDVSCKLEWVDEPKVGDIAIRVLTDPGAIVKLILDDVYDETIEADTSGMAEFRLASPIEKDTGVVIQAEDPYGNNAVLDNDGAGRETVTHALISADFKQKGSKSVDVIGSGEPGYNVMLSVDGVPSGKTTVDENGEFTLIADVSEAQTSIELALSYGVFEDEPFIRQFEMDRTPPMLSIEPTIISDIGGEVQITSETGATISFTGVDANGVKKDILSKENIQTEQITVTLPKLDGLTRIEVSAVDLFGNETDEPEVLSVTASPRVMAGFDMPAVDAVLDSQGKERVTGWIAMTDASVPDDLSLIIEQQEKKTVRGFGAEAGVTLYVDDQRLEDDQDFKDRLAEQMDAQHCWRFEYTLEMSDWSKGSIECSVWNGEDKLDSRGFVIDVNNRRKVIYIALSCAALVGLAVCLAYVGLLSKRIQRISDGKVDPNSGMSKLTERSKNQ